MRMMVQEEVLGGGVGAGTLTWKMLRGASVVTFAVSEYGRELLFSISSPCMSTFDKVSRRLAEPRTLCTRMDIAKIKMSLAKIEDLRKAIVTLQRLIPQLSIAPLSK